jgi:serine O-acetyltransferase
MFDNLRADIREARKLNVDPGWWSQHVRILFHPGTLAVANYRFRHWSLGVRVPVVGLLLRVVAHLVGYCVQLLTGVDIDPRAEIGPGLVVHTPYGVLVGAVQVGANCIIQHGVAITNGAGRVGDNVYFGPGAKVIGRANIGNNVVVVANSLVLTDVPDDTTVLGVPARIRLPRGTDDGGRSITRVLKERQAVRGRQSVAPSGQSGARSGPAGGVDGKPR